MMSCLRATAFAFVFFLLIFTNANAVEVRGPLFEVIDGATYVLDPINFAGFYYDVKNGIGTEKLTLTVTDNRLNRVNGAVYETIARKNNFSFDGWGHYYLMGFLGRAYFAGYADGYLRNESETSNLLDEGRLSQVLIDSNQEINMGSGTIVPLAQEYVLAIRSIDLDGNQVVVELYKGGSKVDSGVISLSDQTANGGTYVFKKSLWGNGEMVVIAIHFKNAFIGVERDLVTVDGIWQIADTTSTVRVGKEYERMIVDNIDSENLSISMSNLEKDIILSRGKDILLIGDMGIKTSSQKDISPENPLRFYVYKVV